MQDKITIQIIVGRAKRIGLGVMELSSEAGLAFSTVYRAMNGQSDLQVSSLWRLYDALVAREIAQRDHLIALHGVPAEANGAAVGASDPVSAAHASGRQG